MKIEFWWSPTYVTLSVNCTEPRDDMGLNAASEKLSYHLQNANFRVIEEVVFKNEGVTQFSQVGLQFTLYLTHPVTLLSQVW